MKRGSQLANKLFREQVKIVASQSVTVPKVVGFFSGNTPPSSSDSLAQSTKKIIQTEKLHEFIPSGPGLLYRGMEGLKEPGNIADTGECASGIYQQRPASTRVGLYVFDQQSSRLFFSTSKCKETVQCYALGNRLLVKSGCIATLGQPFVQICPQNTAVVDEEAIMQDATYLVNQQNRETATMGPGLRQLVMNNNETTVITGTGNNNWRPKTSDIHSISFLAAPGPLLGMFVKTDTLSMTTVMNSGFCPKAVTIELFSMHTGKDAEQQEKMCDRARNAGLIASNSTRILAVEDVSVLMDSPVWKEAVDSHMATGAPLVLSEVPKEIPIGSPQIVDYALAQFKGHKLKIEVEPDEPVSDNTFKA